MKEVKLTQIVKCAGCAAKLPPAFLSEAVHGINWPSNEKIIQDMSGNEDCGVYALNKTEGYLQRLNSTESWDEWLKSRTA